MKIDPDYLKSLLKACQASDKPTFDIVYLRSRGFDYGEPQFEFHMKILNDQRLVEDDDGRRGFGLTKGADGYASWSVLPLRLTAAGHHFIEALSNEEVWHALKSGFKDAGIETLREVSKKLLEGFLKKQMGRYIDL